MLEGPSAFAFLNKLLVGLVSQDDEVGFSEPAFERMFDAYRDPRSSPLDRAVLMRQALLFEEGRRGQGLQPTFILPVRDEASLHDAGLEINGDHVNALKWCPTWLSGSSIGVDLWAAMEKECRADFGINGDPFLANLGYSQYRSRRQRAAAHAVLRTPAGCTLCVTLATGEGKSLLFQLIDSIGFDAIPHKTPSVTLVIVPTVALAIDHAGDTDRPRAWYSENDSNNSKIASAIRQGTQGLCFASPEAACGPMRNALIAASRMGRLRALVIDEAHMVDAWGTGFRTEFQELSGLHFEIRKAAPKGAAPRTICLSATLTDAARKTLATLFPGDDFRSLPAAALRPEPDYWFATSTNSADREAHLIEALLHLPRPAILYVSEVKDAKMWGIRLRSRGFARLRVMHGETPRDDREELLSSWRSGAVDLVVATSAFGLGINNQHVRSVVHACVPESLDRYYQEVGRAGRDGRGCISLVLPTPHDFQIAKTLSAAVVITVDRGLERWGTMFNGPKVALGRNRFALRIDSAPGSTDSDIDMISERNTDWNARVLTLLARAGFLRLLGNPDGDEEQFQTGVWQCVEILNHEHLSPAMWATEVSKFRLEILKDRSKSLDLMQRMMSRKDDCAATTLTSLYSDSDPVCSRCARCRDGGTRPYPVAIDCEPTVAWPTSPVDQQFRKLLDDGNRLVVFMDSTTARCARELKNLLPRLSEGGFRTVSLIGEQPNWLIDLLQGLASAATFVNWPDQSPRKSSQSEPEVVIYGPLTAVTRLNLSKRLPNEERLIILPLDAYFIDRPLQPLRTIFNGRTMTLSQLYAKTLV